METGSLTYRYEIDVKGADRELARIKSSTAGLQKEMVALDRTTASVTKVNTDLVRSTAQLRQQQQQAQAATTSLGAATRDLATSIFGSNTAAVALGTTIGSILTQAIMRGVQAVLQSVDAFAQLRNQLLETREIGLNASAAFVAIQQAAVGSQKPLSELTANYKSLAGQISITEVGIDRFNQAFVNYQQSLGRLQAPTIGSEFAKLFDRLSSLFSDNKGIRNITSQLEVSRQLLTNMLQRDEVQARINALEQDGVFANRKRVDLLREMAGLNRENKQLLEQQDAIEKAKNDAYEMASLTIMPLLNKQLDQQIGLARTRRAEQEVLNQLYQAELKFLQQGAVLREQERKDLLAKLTLAQAASQITGIRESLKSPMQMELQQYQERTNALTTFYQGRQELTAEYNRLMEQEWYRSQVAMRQIQEANGAHLIAAQMRAGQSLVNVLGTIGQKSKAAAVAAIGINTALQASMALQNTSAAATRALAELGPVAGPPAAAGIKAWGAFEVAGIIAAGALQIGGAVKGNSSGPSISAGTGGGSGGSNFASDFEPEQAPDRGRAVTIYMSRGALYTREEVQELMGRIGDEVRNGATLISTKVLPT